MGRGLIVRLTSRPHAATLVLHERPRGEQEMAKIRADETGPLASVSVRIPESLYRRVRELALRHDVTLGQAFDLLLDQIRLEAQDEIEALKAELDKVKKERDKWKKKYQEEIEEATRVLRKRTRSKTK